MGSLWRTNRPQKAQLLNSAHTHFCFGLCYWVSSPIFYFPGWRSQAPSVPSPPWGQALLDLHRVLHILLVVMDQNPGMVCQMQLLSDQQSERITSFDVLVMLFLIQPSVQLAFITTRPHCWPETQANFSIDSSKAEIPDWTSKKGAIRQGTVATKQQTQAYNNSW